MQYIYHKLLKEFDGDYKYLRFPDLWDNIFEVLCSAIALYKLDLVCAETFKYKPTINDSGFITYSSTIYLWYILDNSGYIINQHQNIVKKSMCHGSKYWGENNSQGW